ncbi:hypothetical protein M407DRAFT_31726 [Tulasnella calospora MUT 4182]|uniref:Uncharacterized protein n=1 Tax=Tulasnella calospora MUT 4182 TaxID=1051891 RepID=A0A0C3PUR6_9AGAM|nr:hypothetical protein M407DRAFT_31726 [Tulasnella calospora MUT 4182]
MSLLIRPGISVLINDITDLDPNVNLLPGATSFYSAYPAAQGKAGIYTKWDFQRARGGEGGAEQAVKGIAHGVAPRSHNWRQAVDILKGRYLEFNPPGADVTSVLIIPDIDNNSDHSQLRSPTSVAINRSVAIHSSSAEVDKTVSGDIRELLNALPVHVLESACQNRPAKSSVPSSTATAVSAQHPSPAKPSLNTFQGTAVAKGGTTTRTPTVSFTRGETSNTTVASPTATLARSTNTPAAAGSPLPSTPVKQKPTSGGFNTNTASSCVPYAPQTPSVVRASGSGSRTLIDSRRTLIDSPLRGIGFTAFAASREPYVLGYWTKTVLEFIGCDREVIPLIESCLDRFSDDEDDVELQASLSEDVATELSHFVVNLLKLDAFLKSVGRYA